MFYWNQENFVGLKEVGEKLIDIEGYQFFANYCLLKKKGLKKQALISLEKFIAKIKPFGSNLLMLNCIKIIVIRQSSRGDTKSLLF